MSTNPVENYRLAEAKHHERLAEFRASPVLANLESEIALCRLMIEDALNNNTSKPLPLVRDLIGTIGGLVKIHRAQALEAGELLTKDTLRRVTSDTTRIIADELHHIPGWEEIMDRVCARLSETVETANNRTPETNKLGD